MSDDSLRIVIVGAGTLLGKALNDELALSPFAAADFHLIDDEDALGKLAATADEVTFIQRIEPESFDGCDFAFFAGSPELTRKHWREALQAGSSIVDLTGELEGEPGIPVRAPWIQEGMNVSSMGGPARQRKKPQSGAPDLQTRAVVSAHPVAVLLALLAARAQKGSALRSLWVTLLQPASEYGHSALEELHQQTANLLSFQPLPTEIFGGQTAFTLAVSFGGDSRIALANASSLIRAQFAKIAPLPTPLALQVVQAPIFHGYALSIAVEFDQPVVADELAHRLTGSHLHVIRTAGEFPGNVHAVEEDDVQVLVQPVFEGTPAEMTDRFWLWVVADNLKFAAQNAIACAVELNRLRPRGSVQ